MATTVGMLDTGAGTGTTHWRETYLSPTVRTVPCPTGPDSVLGTRVIFQTDRKSGKPVLTFDDGSDPRRIPRVLNTLARSHIRAIFLVLGPAMRAHPELITWQVAKGHEAGAHSWAHTNVYGVTFSELSDSVDRTCEAIVTARAPSPRLQRPPYGRADVSAMMVVSLKRMDLLLRNVHTPSTAAANAVKDVTGVGSVMLCHDGRTQPSESLFSALEGDLRPLLE